MKLGMGLGYSPAKLTIPMDDILAAEKAGFDSVWAAESYGSDAVSVAAYVLASTSKIKAGTAIMQMQARTPTMVAMTAMSLNALSGNRFLLGIGPSGPQVVEGWYGQAYGKPLTRTKEYISVIKQVIAREGPLEHDGELYQFPYRGEGSSGLGKPLKSILHSTSEVKIYTASITPAGLRCAGEVSDGVFPIWMNPDKFEIIGQHVEEGFAKADGEKSYDNFDVAPFVPVAMGDKDFCTMAMKPMFALYIGGMGAKSKNFYNDYARRLGYEEAAETIQDLYLDGKKEEAALAVPDSLVDECALIGPPERIKERLHSWKELDKTGRIGTLVLGNVNAKSIEVIANEVL
ncbi:MAG: LLM class F420-dependent oxidoreductase [Gammaproteobacteria bacterium]|nr:LLM class F420-dependent oxidoreductase [Gammaproteobacteria bacterium]|tara:strand:- start:6 stop:1043 length:1038 start_codon:yes stop_codon:yes gene_type:complete